MGRELRIAVANLILSVVLLLGGGEVVGAENDDGPLHRAGLIVQYPDGSVATWCLEFPEDAITGMELLQRVGLEITIDYAKGMGGAVCRINGHGCDFPAADCFCQCVGSDCHYWSYWRAEEESWRYSVLGAGLRQVRDGDVDGWAWGDEKSPPPFTTLDRICAAPPTEVPDATFTPVPIKTHTSTALPSRTSGATATPSSTVLAVGTSSPTLAVSATATVTRGSTETPTYTAQPTMTPSPTVLPDATATAVPIAEETAGGVGQAVMFFLMAAIPLTVLVLVARRRK